MDDNTALVWIIAILAAAIAITTISRHWAARRPTGHPSGSGTHASAPTPPGIPAAELSKPTDESKGASQ